MKGREMSQLLQNLNLSGWGNELYNGNLWRLCLIGTRASTAAVWKAFKPEKKKKEKEVNTFIKLSKLSQMTMAYCRPSFWIDDLNLVIHFT